MNEVKRASVRTTLKLGRLEAPVGLYNAIASKAEGEPTFATAGPNGGALRMDHRPAEVAPGEEPTSMVSALVDDDPGPEPEPEQVETTRMQDPPADPPPDDEALTTSGEYRQVLIEEGSGVEVPYEEMRRGVRLDDDSFVDLTNQLKKVDEDSKLDRLEVVTFISARHIPRERIVGGFYLGPAEADEGYDPKRVLRLLYEALRGSEPRAAVVRWTLRAGQKLGVLTVRPDGALLVSELAWPERSRVPNKKCLSHLDAEVKTSEVVAARELITKMAGKREDLDGLRNGRTEALKDLYERALAGEIESDDTFELPGVADQEIEELDRVLEESLAAIGG